MSSIHHILVTFMFLAWLAEGDNYVQDACTVTRYRDICVRTLASFSSTAKRSPSKWARAGVSVTIGEVKNVTQDLIALKKQGVMKGMDMIALSDCIECFEEAVDELYKSLNVLRNLCKSTFRIQMGDLNTWISAALTDEDTCLDGFEGIEGKQVELLRKWVLNASYVTSNALALASKLASTGFESRNDP